MSRKKKGNVVLIIPCGFSRNNIIMRIIFLDLDGVLNTAHHIFVLERQGSPCRDAYGALFDPESVGNLQIIIRETGAKIVITSSWKILMSYQEFLKMWHERNLPGEVIDVCPGLSWSKKRGDEIDAWLEECKEPCQYVIIDDMWADNFNEDQISHLIVVNPYYGIEQDSAERAIRILNAPIEGCFR